MKKTRIPMIILVVILSFVTNTSQILADCSSDVCGLVGWDGEMFYCGPPPNHTEQCHTFVFCGNQNINTKCCMGSYAQNLCDGAGLPTPTATPIIPTPTSHTFSPYEAPSNEFFDTLNPLQHAGGDNIFEDKASDYANTLSTPGGIISRLLTFAFPLAGLILFVMLVWGGFEILIQAPSKKAIDAGKQRVTAAIIGFMLLFASYWIWQIVEVVFGIVIF